MTEDTLREEAIFKGCLLEVKVLEVSLPDGSTGRRELVLLPDAVCAAVVTKDGQSILVRQYRKAAECLCLEVPAGRINPGEDPDLAVVRELREEIGYRSGKVHRLFDFWSSPGFCNERMTAYVVTDAELGESELDPGEFLEVVTLPFTEVVEMAQRGELSDVKSLATVLAAARHLGV